MITLPGYQPWACAWQAKGKRVGWEELKKENSWQLACGLGHREGVGALERFVVTALKSPCNELQWHKLQPQNTWSGYFHSLNMEPFGSRPHFSMFASRYLTDSWQLICLSAIEQICPHHSWVERMVRFFCNDIGNLILSTWWFLFYFFVEIIQIWQDY